MEKIYESKDKEHTGKITDNLEDRTGHAALACGCAR